MLWQASSNYKRMVFAALFLLLPQRALDVCVRINQINQYPDYDVWFHNPDNEGKSGIDR